MPDKIITIDGIEYKCTPISLDAEKEEKAEKVYEFKDCAEDIKLTFSMSEHLNTALFINICYKTTEIAFIGKFGRINVFEQFRRNIASDKVIDWNKVYRVVNNIQD